MNKTQAFNKAKQLILDAIKDEENPKQDFITAYCHPNNIKRYKGNMRRIATEYLQGLALHVPFATHDIEKMGFTDGKNSGEYWYELGRAFVELVYRKK